MLERLESSFAALRRFTADASHELKTPLAVMRADVERAMSERAPAPDKLVALEEALHETTRMADLVDSLLTLARADEGRFDLHRERVRARAARAAKCSRPRRSSARRRGSPCRCRRSPTWWCSRIARGCASFFSTSSRTRSSTRPREAWSSASSAHDRTVAFSVRDTGMGISAADLPHIFERFYRADRARSRSAERGGFGLGLAISQWIAEAHGGTISVRSRLGRGTTFTVTLPVAEEMLAPSKPESISAD